MVWSIVAAVTVVVIIATIITIKVYNARQNGEDINFKKFIAKYEDIIVGVLRDAVVLLQIKIDSFESKEEYETTVIQTAIDLLRKNAEELDVDIVVFNLIDSATLAQIFLNIFEGNLLNIFSARALNTETITTRPELYDTSVVALAEYEHLG